MKDRSWGCSVTRTCLKNTIIDPVGIQERSPDVNLLSSKGIIRQAEAIPTASIDQSVISKEGVDALNKLMLRKLAKESFLSGVPRKSVDSVDSHCHKKASTWEALRDARSTIVSCKCGSHSGKELISTFPYHHDNMMCMDTTKNNSASFEGGKVTEGVDSLLSRIGLDYKKRPESELPIFQNPSRIDRAHHYKTIVSAQDFSKSIASEDAGEFQGADSHSSRKDYVSISAEQDGDFKSSMHTVGHMWCIPEANSVADAMCSESSPSHRCSARVHEGATASRTTLGCPLSTHDGLDKLAPLENKFLKLNPKSPAHTEAASEEVINQSSLPIAIPKEMQIRISEAWNLLFENEGKKHTDSSLVGRGIIRKMIRNEDEMEIDSSKTSWPEGLKEAAYVHWNLRDLMQQEEIEEDVEANLEALRTAHMPKEGHEKLDSRFEELARRLDKKENDAKQEDSAGGRGTPEELGFAKLKYEAAQLGNVRQGKSKTDPNTTPKSHLVEESTIQGYPVLEEKIARRVHSSCPGDNGRGTDMGEKDDELFQGNPSSPETKKLIKLQASGGDSAAVRELEVDWGVDRDDLEVLLEFLTMKNQLKENKHTNVEVVVQTEAIVRELLSRMKLDSDNSSSMDSDASGFVLPKYHVGERIVDDVHFEGRRKRVEKSRCALSSVVTNTSTEDSDTSQAVSIHQNQKVERCRRPPFVVPSSSKPNSFQRMTGSTSTRKPTSCSRHSCDLSEEYGIAASPSRKPEEAKKRSRDSSGGARQPESRRSIQSGCRNVKHITGVAAEEFAIVAGLSKGGKSTVIGMETLNGTSGSAQLIENTENAGITLSNEIRVLTNSPTEVPHISPVMSSYSARNLESRTFTYSSPARTPLNYQREQQLPVLRASPAKRSTLKSPSSPYLRPCRDSPTRKSSSINRSSPLPSPRRQMKVRPATAIPACHLESPRPTTTLVVGDIPQTFIGKPTQDDSSFHTGVSKAVVQQSIALAKDSTDPYADFCDSMLEMMQEKNLWQREEELQDLLQCFLHLNQPVHHQLIHQAFSDVVSFGSPMRFNQKSSVRKERSKVHLMLRPSPSRSPCAPRQVWNVSQTKSPARGGG